MKLTEENCLGLLRRPGHRPCAWNARLLSPGMWTGCDSREVRSMAIKKTVLDARYIREPGTWMSLHTTIAMASTLIAMACAEKAMASNQL